MINNKVMNIFNLVTIQNIGLDRLRPRPSDNDNDDDDEEAQIDHLGPQAPPTRPLKFLQQMAHSQTIRSLSMKAFQIKVEDLIGLSTLSSTKITS